MKYLSLLFSLLLSLHISGQDSIEVVCIENPAVRSYMADSTYYRSRNYAESVITKHKGTPGRNSNLDWPAGKEVVWTPTAPKDSIACICVRVSEREDYADASTFYPERGEGSYVIRNNYPDRLYYYKVEETRVDGSVSEVAHGKYRTTGQVRMIQVLNNRNVRDIGGWPTQYGVPVRYGMLYRSGSLDRMTPDGLHAFAENLGVEAELDLRAESKLKASRLGSDKDLLVIPHDQYLTGIQSKRDVYVTDLRWIIQHLREGKSVDWHCAIGCDRCGTLTFLVEGLLGLDEVSLCRDYELSTFSGYKRTRGPLKSMINHIKMFGDPDNLARCFYNYWQEIGMMPQELDYFLGMMLELPDTFLIEAK